MWLHGQQTSLLGMPSCPRAHWASGGCVRDRAELRQGLYSSFAATSSLNSGIYCPKPKGDVPISLWFWTALFSQLSQKGGAAWAHPVAPLSAGGLSAAESLLPGCSGLDWQSWLRCQHTRSWRQPTPSDCVQGRNLARMATATGEGVEGSRYDSSYVLFLSCSHSK